MKYRLGGTGGRGLASLKWLLAALGDRLKDGYKYEKTKVKKVRRTIPAWASVTASKKLPVSNFAGTHHRVDDILIEALEVGIGRCGTRVDSKQARSVHLCCWSSSAVRKQQVRGLVPGGPEIHGEKIPGDGAQKEEISHPECNEEALGEGHNQAGRRRWCTVVTEAFNSALFSVFNDAPVSFSCILSQI